MLQGCPALSSGHTGNYQLFAVHGCAGVEPRTFTHHKQQRRHLPCVSALSARVLFTSSVFFWQECDLLVDTYPPFGLGMLELFTFSISRLPCRFASAEEAPAFAWIRLVCNASQRPSPHHLSTVQWFVAGHFAAPCMLLNCPQYLVH